MIFFLLFVEKLYIPNRCIAKSSRSMLVTRSIFLYELLESIRDDVLLCDIEREHGSHFVRVGDVGL